MFACVPNLKAQVGVDVVPQFGLHVLRLNQAPSDGVETNAKAGFQTGLNARIGGRFYVQPGVLFTNAKTLYKSSDGPTTNREDIGRNALKTRLAVGVDVIQSEILTLRLMAGPSYDFVLGWADNDNQTYRAPSFRNGNAALDVGVGVDIIDLIALDVGYVHGFSDVYDEGSGFAPDTRYRAFVASVGIVLGNRSEVQY